MQIQYFFSEINLFYLVKKNETDNDIIFLPFPSLTTVHLILRNLTDSNEQVIIKFALKCLNR